MARLRRRRCGGCPWAAQATWWGFRQWRGWTVKREKTQWSL